MADKVMTIEIYRGLNGYQIIRQDLTTGRFQAGVADESTTREIEEFLNEQD